MKSMDGCDMVAYKTRDVASNEFNFIYYILYHGKFNNKTYFDDNVDRNPTTYKILVFRQIKYRLEKAPDFFFKFKRENTF